MAKETKSTAQMNIYETLAAVRQIIGALKKNKAGYGYTYTDEEAILPRIIAGLEKYRLDYYPEMVADSQSAGQNPVGRTGRKRRTPGNS